MRDFAQILAKTLGIFFLVSFSVFSVSAQSAIRFVLPIVSEACFNGIDDDEDGLVDYPADTDCENQNDQSEHHITATCSVSSTSIQLGQSVTWTVSPTGGSTTYTYLWSGVELSGTTDSVAVTYPTAGTKNGSVTVTSGIDSIIVNCPNAVSVASSDSTPNPSSSGGGSSSSSLGAYSPLTNNSIDIPVLIQKPANEGDVPESLNSAPETINTPTKQNTPKAKPQAPRVKIKTQMRLTLRDDRGISLTNEPVPVPPRADVLPLFDVISELSGISMNVVNGGTLGKVAPGELLPVSVKLLNVSGTRRLDVQVYYSVISRGNESVYSSSETVAVETTASFVKMVQIPYYLVPGVYSVQVSIKYDGQAVPATSHFPFTVESKIGGIFRTTLLTYAILSILGALIMAGCVIIFRKKYHQTSRLSPIDYSNVPSNIRTFYEIISDTIMDMRQRVGDQAILIANSIDGLKLDPESGKVLSISENPSKIIAELVSKYELELGKKVSFLFRHKPKN
ncbi:hypothetical protein KA057_01735 [Candidatus Gracilibacteria bacterium]|nr:hypothetical protein [Candidatus Gracilibacteria bacterium]